MKKALTLISTLGIFTTLTTGIIVSAPESAAAFCVHNLTGGPIAAYDSVDDARYRELQRLTPGVVDSIFWRKWMNPD